MDVSLYQVRNVFRNIKKIKLDDCYICLDQICDKLDNGAVIPYKCRHPICIHCFRSEVYKISLSKLSTCGICRAKPNRYITESPQLCKVSYSDSQSLFVPTDTINNDTLYRDHIQHIIAHAF